MTPKQLKSSTTIELIRAFEQKAVCHHSQREAQTILNELIKRLGYDKLQWIDIEFDHCINGFGNEGKLMIHTECDKVVKSL
jgi:hypothetical protein